MTVQIPASDDRRLAQLSAAITRVLEAAAHRRKQRTTATIERQLVRALRRAWRAQQGDVLAALATVRSRFPEDDAAAEAGRFTPSGSRVLSEADPEDIWDELIDGALDKSKTPMTDALGRSVDAALSAGADSLTSQFSLVGSFTLDNPAAVGYADDYAAEMVTKINQTTRDGLRRIVTEAVGDGWSYDRLADTIKAQFSGFDSPKPQQHIRDRATLVAVTEVGNAYEAGTRGMAQQLADAGLAMEKSWLTVGDDRVSDDCQSNTDAGWIAIDDTFPSGDDRPLAHPGCRCTLLYRRKPA